MKSNTIKIENRGAVAILSLNRPEVFHSFNREMSHALLEALSTAEEDNNIRAIIITGSGIIAAVNGIAAGAGANLALCCDIILASNQSSFIQAFSKIGLIPDTGGTFFLPRMIGFHRAMAYMMTAEKMSAQEAKDCGLVFKIFDDQNFLEECIGFATNLANMPTRALALTKKALNISFSNTMDQQLGVELLLQIEASQTHDFKEGIEAFLQKRKPNFIGK